MYVCMYVCMHISNLSLGLPSPWLKQSETSLSATGTRSRGLGALSGSEAAVMDWFKGKSAGNHGFSYEIWGFPVTVTHHILAVHVELVYSTGVRFLQTAYFDAVFVPTPIRGAGAFPLL